MQQQLKRLKKLLTRDKRRAKLFKRATSNPFAIPVAVFAGLLLLTIAGYFLYQPPRYSVGPKVVIINHDHVQQIVPSIEPTVGKLLKRLHIHIGQGDVVEPSLATSINQDDFRINIYRAVPVEIVENGQDTFTFSAAATPRAIVQQAGVQLYAADDVNEAPVSNFLSQYSIGEQVVIDPATPVNLNLYGTPVNIRTHAATVSDLIREDNIKLANTDQVIPALDTPLIPNIQVFIVRKGQKIVSVTQSIAMPVKTQYDNSLAYGTSAVLQRGSAGQEVITYQDELSNGVVVGRNLIQTVITVPPVTEIVAEGDNLSGIKGDMALAGIAPSDFTYADYIISHESGWCPTKAQGEDYCPATPDDPMTPYGYGLCQATPGYKMSSAGSDWETNPITQLKWCSGYAESHYGSWYNAYIHWVDYSWW